jgi:hypothetical protein
MYMNCAMITIGGGGERAANATTDAEERGVPKHMLEMAADDKTPVSKAMEEVAKAKEAANLKDNAKPMEESKPMDNTKPMESTKPMASIKPMENAKPKEQSKPKGHAKQSKAADSFDSLPDLFVANVDQAGKCVTIEGEAVNVPKPGPNVIGKADGKGYKCEGNAPFLDADSQTTKNATSTDKKMSKIASSFGTSTATAGARTLSTEATTSNQFSNYVGQWSCTDGEILCSPDGMSFAMCNYGRPVFMGSVAAGTWCRWGAITARW